MHPLSGGVAVITGAASGFGWEACQRAADLGMRLVMVDVQADALEVAAAAMRQRGVTVLPQRVDVSRAADMDALGQATLEAFGPPNFVFNNAGVGGGGLIWEHSAQDWEWIMGVNVMGVAHGVRVFTPLMLEAARRDPAWCGHVVNTASMAGLVNAPTMGVYNASKHAVVSISETLQQDLSLVTRQMQAHVLCPYFVPTGIHRSARNRPSDLATGPTAPTKSQRIAQAMSDKAVTSGKVSAAQVMDRVFEAMATGRFYVFSHPQALLGVQTRMEDLLQHRNPSDPFAARPGLREQLQRDLQAD